METGVPFCRKLGSSATSIMHLEDLYFSFSFLAPSFTNLCSTYPFSDTLLFIALPYFSVYLKIRFGDTKPTSAHVNSLLKLSSSCPREPGSTLILPHFIPDPFHLFPR